MTGGDTPDADRNESARFRRVEELFHDLVDQPAAERAAVLEPLREREPEIHDHLLGLLGRADAGGALTAAPAALQDALLGSRELRGSLGPYRLLQRIGEGGMGVVYEAEQAEPIRRRVAVKLIRFGHDSARVVARFRAEQQTLALMRHPNVALVHDAGTSADGRPFFVMELVEGEPLHHYCDQRGLDLEHRLGLFLEVCAGVEHAHQKGVIHRDLKPSNILVTEESGTPRPKIIDFGIAKAVGDASGAVPGLTSVDEAIGTLEYMSPEQTRGTTGIVDTRTDVYALGVVLYELLTGELPIPAESLRDVSLAAAYHAIQERDPPPPSRRTGTKPAAPSEAATRRGTDPATLARRLRGDLDWIAMRALAKDPDRRYPAVSQLQDDIARFLRHEPVSAGPPSATYRLRKFARRHRVGVAAGSLVLLALLTGIVGTTSGLLRAQRAEAEARAAEAAAKVEASTAHEVTDFLVGLFRVNDPSESRGRAVTASEILERGATRVEEELSDEPEVLARLRIAIGRVYANLGLYENARAQLEAALSLREQHLAPTDPELAHSHVELGRLLRLQDDASGAESAYRRAIEILELGPSPAGFDLGNALNELGLVLGPRDPDGARSAYARARELAVAEHGEQHEQVWRADANLAALEARRGNFEPARASFLSALTAAEVTLGADHPDLGPLLGNLAFVLRKLGHHREALALQERDLAISERALGPTHPTVGVALLNLAAVHQRLGDYDAAARAGERAIAVLDASLPLGHRHRELARNNHAHTLLRTGDYEGSRDLLVASVTALADREDDATAQDRVRSQLMLSVVERLAGNPGRATNLVAEVLQDPKLDRWPALGVDAHFALAHALARLPGRTTDAVAALDRALAAAHQTPGVAPSDIAFSEARFWALSGDVERALAQLELAVEEGYSDALLLTDPDLTAVRQNGRFAALARRMGSRLESKGGDGA
jgi:eukaryotic-like serine/threonine-protein kinase